MKALAVEDKQIMCLCETEIPELKDKEVLVKVAYCGICGSDLPRFFDGAVHNFPQILGHEFSGTIVKAGKEVKTGRKDCGSFETWHGHRESSFDIQPDKGR